MAGSTDNDRLNFVCVCVCIWGVVCLFIADIVLVWFDFVCVSFVFVGGVGWYI